MVTQNPDGSWTVTYPRPGVLADGAIVGIPTKELADQIERALEESFEAGASSVDLE